MVSIEDLWKSSKFSPNDAQKEAILHINGPLFITAGPGSGKTSVLLWRTLNLIVFHGIKPEEIYLSTFTEKAATQLKEGLRSMLGEVSSQDGQHYDISKMYIGTVHSSCQRILSDRNFASHRERPETPALMEDLQQYLFLSNTQNWKTVVESGGFHQSPNEAINKIFTGGQGSQSRHIAVTNCISLFNRLSEELISPDMALRKLNRNPIKPLVKMYRKYLELLSEEGRTDFSMVQQAALDTLNRFDGAGRIFKHVIIDEYQDTNTVQERLFFALARGSKNICVVGDDDQALYRFRGATVENFVQFPKRCQQYLKCKPRTISLEVNYRSQDHIVGFYGDFITHDSCDWTAQSRNKTQYRVPKEIKAHRSTSNTAVVASEPGDPDTVADEIAGLVKKLIRTKKVQDPNQIAFLYPSLGSVNVQRMIEALKRLGIESYAPRAGHFFDVPEALDMFGLFLHVFGKPERNEQFHGRDLDAYREWIDNAHRAGRMLLKKDVALARYVSNCRKEIAGAVRNAIILDEVAQKKGWDRQGAFDPDIMQGSLLSARGLSPKSKNGLSSRYFTEYAKKRFASSQRPLTLGYVINRFSSLDWTILDLFYRLSGFNHFKKMFDRAANGDEGPVCNLSLISGYLDSFLEFNRPILTGNFLQGEKFTRVFFNQYIYSLYRRGESEYENTEDPFPKGRVPFLTIHQAKGLEFPVVVLGSPKKSNRGPQTVEKMVAPLLPRSREPLERIAEFDKMRMFYVALSRAMNLLVIAHFRSSHNQVSEPFKSILDEDNFPRIKDLKMEQVPEADVSRKDLPTTYSYTGDYLFYKRCPRNYMVFRRFGFAPSRSQTGFFGNLIHQTVEDLHHLLIDQRSAL